MADGAIYNHETVYLDGETGVRIEDLVRLDVAARRVERLTQFPREVIVVGG